MQMLRANALIIMAGGQLKSVRTVASVHNHRFTAGLRTHQ